MHITEREELQKLDIGTVLIVSLLGRFSVLTIDTGNMRLLLRHLDVPDSKPVWYGYDLSARAWRLLFQVYSGSLQFDTSQKAVGIDKEGVTKGCRQAPKRHLSTHIHSSKFGHLDPSDRYHKGFLDP